MGAMANFRRTGADDRAVAATTPEACMERRRRESCAEGAAAPEARMGSHAAYRVAGYDVCMCLEGISARFQSPQECARVLRP